MKEIISSALKAGIIMSVLDLAIYYYAFQSNKLDFMQNLMLFGLDIIIFQMVVYAHSFSFKALFLSAIICLNIVNICDFSTKAIHYQFLDETYREEKATQAVNNVTKRAQERGQQRGVKYNLSSKDLEGIHESTLQSYSFVGLLKFFFFNILASLFLALIYAGIGILPFDSFR